VRLISANSIVDRLGGAQFAALIVACRAYFHAKFIIVNISIPDHISHVKVPPLSASHCGIACMTCRTALYNKVAGVS
jgi:hypothetical protein